jgi:hypothetical protein
MAYLDSVPLSASAAGGAAGAPQEGDIPQGDDVTVRERGGKYIIDGEEPL